MAKLTLKTALSFETQARLYSAMGKNALLNEDTAKPSNVKQASEIITPLIKAQQHLDSLEKKPNCPRPRDWKKYVQKVKDIQEWLHEKWPLVFDIENPKPLKRHIEKDVMLVAEGYYTITQIRRALGAYTSRTDYMKAMLEQNWRYDLDNQAVEEITPIQKDFTQTKMADKDQIVKQRMREFDERITKLKMARGAVGRLKQQNKDMTRADQQAQKNLPRRQALIERAEIEGKQLNCGDDNNAGVAIEKYLSPIRLVLGKSNPEYLNVKKGFDWCAAFVYYLVNECGFNVPLVPVADNEKTMALVGVWYEWAKASQKFYKPNIALIPGDIILFDKLVSSSVLDHMGIVISPLTTHIITAEGNVNKSTGIFKREYNETYRGFIRL